MVDMADLMAGSIDTLTDVITTTSQCATRSDALRLETQAIKVIEEEEEFSKEDIAYAVMAITENASRANAYLGITDKEARTKYLLCMMKKVKKEE